MKTFALLFLLAASSAFAQSVNLDRVPLLDAPGPGYRETPGALERTRVVCSPLPQPTLTMLQATTIADRELQPRGLSYDFILRDITFVRATKVADSSYVATISGLDCTTTTKRREFRIDMRGAVTFREGEER